MLSLQRRVSRLVSRFVDKGESIKVDSSFTEERSLSMAHRRSMNGMMSSMSTMAAMVRDSTTRQVAERDGKAVARVAGDLLEDAMLRAHEEESIMLQGERMRGMRFMRDFPNRATLELYDFEDNVDARKIDYASSLEAEREVEEHERSTMRLAEVSAGVEVREREKFRKTMLAKKESERKAAAERKERKKAEDEKALAEIRQGLDEVIVEEKSDDGNADDVAAIDQGDIAMVDEGSTAEAGGSSGASAAVAAALVAPTGTPLFRPESEDEGKEEEKDAEGKDETPEEEDGEEGSGAGGAQDEA